MECEKRTNVHMCKGSMEKSLGTGKERIATEKMGERGGETFAQKVVSEKQSQVMRTCL